MAVRVALWMTLALLIAGCARGEEAGSQPPGVSAGAADPQVWSAYLAAAADAERIEDRVERCLAYPDLPGNHWPAGSAEARCPLLGGPLLALEDIESMLASKGGPERLEDQFTAWLDAHHRDPAQRDSVFRAFQAFSDDDDSRRVAKSWLAQSPDSAFARTALGALRVIEATNARGSEFAAKTPRDSFEAMHRLMPQGVELLQSALAIEPRLSPACVHLMVAARFIGDDGLRDSAAAHCLKVDPLSWHVRTEWQMQRDPRWGGSFEALDATAEELRPLAAQNPALGGMLSRGIGMRARAAHRGGTPLPALSGVLEEASRIAPDPWFIGDAGLAAKQAGDQHKALGYLSQALRLAPDNTQFLAGRADVRRKLGDYEGSVADAQRVTNLSQKWGHNYSVLGQSLAKLGRTEEARDAFHKAMQFPKQRQWAFMRWCETYILGGLYRDEALACTQGLLSEYPDDAEPLFMRSWVLYELKDPAAADLAERFRAAADMSDHRHRQMASELARIAN